MERSVTLVLVCMASALLTVVLFLAAGWVGAACRPTALFWVGRAFRRAVENGPMTPKPKRRRLTQAEFEAEVRRATNENPYVKAADIIDFEPPTKGVADDAEPLITRTGRRKSWWQRGWKR